LDSIIALSQRSGEFCNTFGGKPENICSLRDLPVLTHCGHRGPIFAVMHNSSRIHRMW
jgi:hypothetical protein